jgi:NTP pyrophosphatase (non-canonical NTP hydrolase)
MKDTFDTLIEKVTEWADDRDLLDQDPRSQMLKVIEEVGETASALAKLNEDALKDGIGDTFVTLIILAAQCDMDPTDCLQTAYNEIKNRKGKTVNGTFQKE